MGSTEPPYAVTVYLLSLLSALLQTNIVHWRSPLSPTNFIPSGPWRMVSHPDHQLRLAELKAVIEAKYESELESATIFQRWTLRRKINAEFEVERNKIEPSKYAL